MILPLRNSWFPVFLPIKRTSYSYSPIFVRRAMNRSLRTFFLFLHLARGQLSQRSMDDGPFPEDLYPRQSDVVLRHCSEERLLYRQLAVISVDEDPGYQFYRNINEEFGVPVQVFNDIKSLNSLQWRACVLLYLTNAEVDNFLKSVITYRWLPSNIYVLHARSHHEHTWTMAAAELWRRKNVHKFVLSTNESNLVFDPFALSSSNSKYDGKSKLSKDSFGAPKDLGDSADPLRTRNTFGGYEVNVALFPYATVKKENGTWSGMDAYAMTEICNRMNVTPRVFDPPDTFGWFSNGNFTGTLGMLVYRECDLAFNGFFIKDYGSRDLEFTEFIEMDKIYVFVPRLGRVPEYLLIARIFSFYSWTLIVFGNSFISLTYTGMTCVTFGPVGSKLEKFFANSTPKFQGLRTLERLTRVTRFLAFWILYSLYPMNNVTKFSGERLHLAFGLIFGIVISGCFTSQLASSFSKPAFLKNIDTLRELDDSGLEILTNFPNLVDDVFADNEIPTLRSLQSKLRIKNVSEIERRVFEERNAAYLDRRRSVISRSEEGHIVPEYPKEYHLAYPITKGSPFLPRINRIIGRLRQGGFYQKWFRDLHEPSRNDQSQNPVVIRLPHLYIPFFILFVGLGISGAVFCLELIHSRAERTAEKT